MASVSDALAGIVAELPAEERGRLVGVGVCAAGQIDWEKGVVVYASPNIPGWTGTPVKSVLEARLELPVTVDNDANAAAYGEWWVGAGKGARSLVMLTIGTGIGGGVILNGQVLRGSNWRGGEIGHLILVAGGDRCNCGQVGCLEVYASGTAIARAARDAGLQLEAPAVFAAAAGSPAAQAVLNRAARALACGVVSLASVLDPERFVLGGGVAMQPAYLPLVREALADPSVSGQRGFDPARIVGASLEVAAGAIGAAGQLMRERAPSA